MVDIWNEFADMEMRFYSAGQPDRERHGDGWFAALSGVRNGELNVCGLTPGATRASAAALVAALGDLPALVFTSQLVGNEVRALLVAEGFEIASTREPLMRTAVAPAPMPGPFRIAAATPSQIGLATRVTAEAHQGRRATSAR